MANKDITESGVQEVLRTMGIPTSFKGFREDVTGRAEALATVGSGMAGTMAGMGGGMIEMLRSGNPQAALDQYRQIQEAMTFVPRTQKGLENVQDIGEFFEPVANIYERFGEGVTEQTGSPVVGEFAQEFVDPLDLMGLGAVSAIPAIAKATKKAKPGTPFAKPKVNLDLGVPEEELDAIADRFIKAYHGSPYDFEKFMLEFMGSGEGAQAYGWGLYFAQLADVARGYRKDVTAQRAADEILPIDAETEAELNKVLNSADMALANVRDTVMFEAKNPTMEDIQRVARQKRERSTNEYYERAYETIERMASEGKFTLPEQGTDLNAIYDELTGPRATDLDYQKAEIIEQIMIDGDVLGVIDRQKEFNQFTPEAYAWFEKEIEPTFKAPGTLYEVNIKASPDELLDWDKPFGEQSQKVKEAISDIFDERSQQIRGRPQIYTRPVDEVIESITGSDLYNRLEETEAYTKWAKEGLANGTLKMSETNTPKSVSMFLESRGIKGITYADQLSRAAEGGTSNFVIFDPRIIKIAKKYGVAIPVAGAMLLQIEKELEKQTEQAPVA